MNILTLDCTEIGNGKIKVILQGEDTPTGPITIEALNCRDEVFLGNIQLNCQIREHASEQFSITSAPFKIEYEVTSRFQAFMGSHIDWNLNYPFFSSEEAFIGSGILPVIEGFAEVERSLWYDLRIVGVPDEWKVSTSLLASDCKTALIPMEKVSQFFFYASRSAHHLLQSGMRLVVSNNADLGIMPEEIISYGLKSIQAHEQFLGPNEYAKTALLLILQSPKNFDEITHNKTFSTGENYTGGIALYGPDRKELFSKLGHPTYVDFLLGGLHHEIGHAYTSAGAARFKSILYASSDCPRDHRFLIGEKLNGYFNGAIRATFDPNFHFSVKNFVSHLTSEIVPGKRSFAIDLFLFDLALREEVKISLFEVFTSMLEAKRKYPGPYFSAEFLLESAESLSGRKLNTKLRDLLFMPEPENYQCKLEAGLKSQGWMQNSLPNDKESAIRFFVS